MRRATGIESRNHLSGIHGSSYCLWKILRKVEATTFDLEILLYLDSAHILIRLDVPFAKVAVVSRGRRR